MPFREDYNMLVSHSPPVFSHSPPTSFASYHQRAASFDTFNSRVRNANCRSQQIHQSKTAISNPMKVPRRGCLVIRTTHDDHDDDRLFEDDDDLIFSPTRRDKKRVVFADDRGMALTQIRVMTEPSNAPPVWSVRFLAQVTQGMSAEPTVVHEPWEITFSQPAAEYLEFRKRLDTQKVSLENVIVKDVEQAIVGTIKVCNIAFDKQVFIRYTVDSWKSYKDQDCTFVGNTSSSVSGTTTSVGAFSLYDTFSFRIEMAPNSRNIDFCVCFQCGGTEFWDNNGTRNYSVVKKVLRAKYGKMAATQNKMATGHQPIGIENVTNGEIINQKCADIFQTRMESWSEFASWSQLENTNPYW